VELPLDAPQTGTHRVPAVLIFVPGRLYNSAVQINYCSAPNRGQPYIFTGYGRLVPAQKQPADSAPICSTIMLDREEIAALIAELHLVALAALVE
jgi:hypothetical protein